MKTNIDHKIVPVTLELLAKSDYYRAQVNLPHSIYWGAGYMAILEYDQQRGHKLRDLLGPAIEGLIHEELGVLAMEDKNWPKYIANWDKERVAPCARERVAEFRRLTNPRA